MGSYSTSTGLAGWAFAGCFALLPGGRQRVEQSEHTIREVPQLDLLPAMSHDDDRGKVRDDGVRFVSIGNIVQIDPGDVRVRDAPRPQEMLQDDFGRPDFDGTELTEKQQAREDQEAPPPQLPPPGP